MRRILYVENKAGGLDGSGRIGWVEFSRSGRTLRYEGRGLVKTKSGYKDNCIDVALTEYRAGAATRTGGKTRQIERKRA